MTFIDSRQLPAEEKIERDICIIGAGPAGIAIAREFLGSPYSVALLESGDVAPGGDAQDLNDGELAGLPYPDLSTARIRAFGGTTWHWGGNVRPLDPIDFAPRPWIRDTGWPIAWQDMTPYYERAGSFFHLPAYTFDETHWRRLHGAPWSISRERVDSRVFHSVGEPGLYPGEAWRPAIEAARDVDLFHHATVLEIVTDDGARTVTGLRARTPDGRILNFGARIFVLAAGGIENPRLLLLSSGRQPDGLGNEHGLVGRYFQEHLTVPHFATFYPARPNLSLRYYLGTGHDWGEAWGVMRLSDEVMRAHRLPNVRFQLATVVNAFNKNQNRPGFRSLNYLLGMTPVGRDKELAEHVAHVIGDIDTVADAIYYRLVHHPDYPLISVEVVHIGEQTPNRDSRVHLSDKTDRYGQRRPVLDWRVQDADSAGAWESAKQLQQALAAAGLGQLQIHFPERAFEAEPPKPHFHHMGTTRMHAEPRSGVVNADCRLHRCDNLYVSGSSVFPNSGNVNPTLTIVALAIRLADHLKGRLRT